MTDKTVTALDKAGLVGLADLPVMTLGEGWTPALETACALRCGDEFGDPPCWSLAGDTAYGETTVITPCAECRAEAGQP